MLKNFQSIKHPRKATASESLTSFSYSGDFQSCSAHFTCIQSRRSFHILKLLGCCRECLSWSKKRALFFDSSFYGEEMKFSFWMLNEIRFYCFNGLSCVISSASAQQETYETLVSSSQLSHIYFSFWILFFSSESPPIRSFNLWVTHRQ